MNIWCQIWVLLHRVLVSGEILETCCHSSCNKLHSKVGNGRKIDFWKNKWLVYIILKLKWNRGQSIFICRENYVSFHLVEELSVYHCKCKTKNVGCKNCKQSEIYFVRQFPMGVYETSLVLQLFSLIESSRFLNLSRYYFPLYGRNITFKEFA